METEQNNYLESVKKQFLYYKLLGDRSLERVDESQLYWQYNEESNSMAVIVQHLHGNMMSRWTDFLNSDGEKEWRKRDEEFESLKKSKEEIVRLWNEGWACLMKALDALKPEQLGTIIYIRNQGHTVMEAINRQLAHYPYHVGQMVFLGKMLSARWDSLSIPRNASASYNKDKFAQEKGKTHFTDEYLKQPKKE